MSSNEPVKNGCEVMYEMFHILNCDNHSLLFSLMLYRSYAPTSSDDLAQSKAPIVI